MKPRSDGVIPPHQPNCFGCGPENASGIGLELSGGVNLPWNLVLAAAVAASLLFTRLTFEAEGPMADADHLVGALALTPFVGWDAERLATADEEKVGVPRRVTAPFRDERGRENRPGALRPPCG